MSRFRYPAVRPKCSFCDRPADVLGLFCPTPELSRRLLAPPGKHQGIIYHLCKKHARKPQECADRLDAALMAEAERLSGPLAASANN